MNEVVDWNDKTLARWIGSITRESTKRVYKNGLKLYLEYTGLSASQLIDEALEDQKRDPREKTDIVKQRLIGFYHWLISECPKKTGPKGDEVSKGLSSKSSHTYVNAVRSFYGTFDIYVKLRGRSKLPKAKVENKREILDNVEVKRLLDHATNPRDRAMILTMFQSGIDVSTLCDLKYKHVAKGLLKGELPLKLELHRPKTGTEYYTFLGRDAVEALKAYLNNVKSRGIELNGDTPLFLKLSHKALKGEAIKPHLIQHMMRTLAVRSGLVDKNYNGNEFNPVGPHALRESFGSIMTNKGVPKTIVDFWLGHEIGEMAEAYQRVQFEDLKRLYLEKEAFISVSTGEEVQRLSQKVEEQSKKIEDQREQLQTLVNGLTAENLELREKMRDLSLRVKKSEEGLRDMREIMKKLLEGEKA